MAYTRFVAAVFALLVLGVAGPVAAQAPYPVRPMKLVVPLTAGGPGDVLARAFAHKMSEALGQQVVIENRAGDTGNIGAEFVARSVPDGYTLLLSGAAMMIHPAMRAHMPYDNVKDFAPITLVANFPLLAIVNTALPIKTIPELIDYARKNPGVINYGSVGSGGTIHLAGVLLGLMAGVDLVHVPYRGLPEAVTDLIAGRVQLVFAGAPYALPNAEAGRVRILATTGARRTAVAPDVPTVAESGLLGYDITNWNGVWAPAGTPRAIINRWHTELVRILQTTEIKKRWLSLGADPVFSATPEEFAALIRTDMIKWAKVVKDSGAKVD